MRYRIIGSDAWLELELSPYSLTLDLILEGLIEGEQYEYQCIFEDNSGNQLITEWERL